MADISVNVRVVFANQDAVDAFEAALNGLRELLQESPWDTKLAQAVEDFERSAESFKAILLDQYEGEEEDFDDDCEFDDDFDEECWDS